jgi:hypothetical protein
MASALQASIAFHDGEMPASGSTDIRERYRRFRDYRMEIQTSALENIPRKNFLAFAKRIGLSDGKALFTDDMVELALVFDLALYSTKAGRTRAIDRCARKRLATEPDEVLVLRGLQASRFSVFRVIGTCGPAGVLLEDLLRGGTIHLLDEGLEQSAKPGAIFGMRIAPIEEFMITCGAIVPLDTALFAEIIDFLCDDVPDASLAILADDWRFAASFYEMAIELGLISRIAYQ